MKDMEFVLMANLLLVFGNRIDAKNVIIGTVFIQQQKLKIFMF